MNLNQIHQTIAESSDEYWNAVKAGPLFNYNLGNVGEVATVAGYHSVRLVLIEDVDIAIEYGLSTGRAGWKASWSRFPDRSIEGQYCDIFYRGSLVDRTILASVDGGRAMLPMPEERGGELIVMDRPYQVARLVDSVDGNDFDEYFRRSGIRRWPS